MYEVINTLDIDIEELKDMRGAIDIGIKKEHIEDAFFNIIIVDNHYIHDLNKNYRKINRPTDVITFALEDVEDEVESPFRVLGDIYISYDKAVEQAEEYQHSLKRELCFLAIHGFYHLLGYDHMNAEEEKVMFEKQEEVLYEAGIQI